MDDLIVVKLTNFDGESDSWPMFFLRLSKLIKQEDAEKAKKKDAESFGMNDAKVQGIVLSYLSDGAAHMIEDCTTTHCKRNTRAASFVLLRFNKALDLSYKPGDDMSDHLGKLNGLVNQIKIRRIYHLQ
jgi:hypothetical protein